MLGEIMSEGFLDALLKDFGIGNESGFMSGGYCGY